MEQKTKPTLKARIANAYAHLVMFVNAQAGAFRLDARGIANIGGVLSIALIVVVAVVGLQVLAALLPIWFDGLEAIGENFSLVTTGNASADALLPTFQLIVAFVGLFAIVGLVFVVMKIRKGGGSV